MTAHDRSVAQTGADAEQLAAPVSCLVFTLNEQLNLPHCLASLNWCDDVVVVDSFSRDGTEEVARRAGARFVQHEFTGFGDQRNWALANVPLRHEWALILDADERTPSELVRELSVRLPWTPDSVSAFRVRRRFHMWGRWLKYSALYPTWVVRLVRVGRVRYLNRGHAETQLVDGHTAALDSDLLDENRRGLRCWWRRQIRYARQEAVYELSQSRLPILAALSFDPLKRRSALKALARDMPGRPFWFFVYSFLIRLGFLDGLDGLRFCAMKAACQRMIQLSKRKLKQGRTPARYARPALPRTAAAASHPAVIPRAKTNDLPRKIDVATRARPRKALEETASSNGG